MQAGTWLPAHRPKSIFKTTPSCQPWQIEFGDNVPACEYDEEGNLIECDNCVQNFLLSDSYSCCSH